MAKNRLFRIGSKKYYLHENIYSMVKQLNITQEEIEKEYNKMIRSVPYNGVVTYNHAAQWCVMKRGKQ